MGYSFAVVLLCAVSTVCAGENLSGERFLPLHDNRDAYTPCAAFVKGGYIVAWQSGRLAPGDLREGLKFNADVVGYRLDKNGAALDATPFVICKAPDLQERPRAAAGKDMTLVVWQDLRNGKDWDVYAARISPEGKVLDPDGFLVSGGAHNQANPHVAWDGKTFVIVWQDFRSGKRYDIYAARISIEGRVLDPEGIRLSNQGERGSGYDPAVASAGDSRSFVYWNCGGPFGARLDALSEGLFLNEGKPGPLFKQPFDAGTFKGAPGGRGNSPLFAAAGKDVYLVTWRNEHPVGRSDGDPTPNAYLFDAQGKRIADLTLSGERHRIAGADIVWDGSAFVAAWMEYRTKEKLLYVAHEHIFASRISTAGKVVGPYQLVAGTRSSPPNWSYERSQLGKNAAGEREAPAMNPCVASDGAGTTLIAYEKHPETADVPIKIGFRVLTAR
jgi:hypothetical protein